MARRNAPGIASRGRLWHLTVASADGGEMLFHGSTELLSELEAAAAEAHRLRPDAIIWINPPAGAVYRWRSDE